MFTYVVAGLLQRLTWVKRREYLTMETPLCQSMAWSITELLSKLQHPRKSQRDRVGWITSLDFAFCSHTSGKLSSSSIKMVLSFTSKAIKLPETTTHIICEFVTYDRSKNYECFGALPAWSLDRSHWSGENSV